MFIELRLEIWLFSRSRVLEIWGNGREQNRVFNNTLHIRMLPESHHEEHNGLSSIQILDKKCFIKTGKKRRSYH